MLRLLVCISEHRPGDRGERGSGVAELVGESSSSQAHLQTLERERWILFLWKRKTRLERIGTRGKLKRLGLTANHGRRQGEGQADLSGLPPAPWSQGVCVPQRNYI